MAKRKKKQVRKSRRKTGGKDFKKGADPRRGTALANKAVRNSARPTAQDIVYRKVDKELVNKFLFCNSHLTVDELIAKLNTGKVGVLEGMIIKGYIKAYRTGDVQRMNFFFDRMIGPVQKHIKHEVDNPYKGMSEEQLLELKKKYAAQTYKDIEFHNMLTGGAVEKQGEKALKNLEEYSQFKDEFEIDEPTSDD